MSLPSLCFYFHLVSFSSTFFVEIPDSPFYSHKSFVFFGRVSDTLGRLGNGPEGCGGWAPERLHGTLMKRGKGGAEPWED